MGVKTFVIEEIVKPIEFKFKDGTIKHAVFNPNACQMYVERVKNPDELAQKPWELASEILYCGMYEMDNSVTLDEARTIVLNAGPGLINEIYKQVIGTADKLLGDEDRKRLHEKLDSLS